MSFYQILAGAATGAAVVGGLLYSRISGASSRAGIPEKMKAVMLVKNIDFKAAGEGSFEVQTIATPVPKPGQVLVKVERSPINPSDIGNMKGSYDKTIKARTLPYQLGFEGSGTVVQSGGGVMAWWMNGKRVAMCQPQMGVWAEYVVVPALNCLELPANVSFEEGCSCFVNPLTVIAFLTMANQRGVKAIVHTAAASQLGKMLVRMAPHYGVTVICVVRKAEHVKELTDLGAKHVLNSDEKDYDEKLKSITEQLKATLAFDAISGASAAQLFNQLPVNSEVVVYGGLSQQSAGPFETGALISTGKRVSGFYLGSFLPKQSLLTQAGMLKTVAKHVKVELRTEVAQAYPMEQTKDALMSYVKNMSGGKVVIAPSLAAAAAAGAGAGK